jgi:hypothetical protein
LTIGRAEGWMVLEEEAERRSKAGWRGSVVKHAAVWRASALFYPLNQIEMIEVFLFGIV